MTAFSTVSARNASSAMPDDKLRITLLADEWKSSKGGLSTMNRELAIHLAKHPSVSVTFFVPKCDEDDKKSGRSHNINIVEAKERYGFDNPVDWLGFAPKDQSIDIIIGHDIKLGKYAQVIKESHDCKWVQVVHTAFEELSMFKTYSNSETAISKGDKKQWTALELCQIADLVVAVGPNLEDFYSTHLTSSGKHVFNLTPGIFPKLSDLTLSTEGKKFRVVVLGRGDREDFELKGFDIAAKAVAKLKDESYHLTFVGAPNGRETQVADQLLSQGLKRSQLTVKRFLENRDKLETLLSTANLVIIPSRAEGFGLTALEALSAGLPFLVSRASGFGEALEKLPSGTSWIVDSEDSGKWADAIRGVREKGRETALKECRELRRQYNERYSWERQSCELVEQMFTLVNGHQDESIARGKDAKTVSEDDRAKRLGALDGKKEGLDLNVQESKFEIQHHTLSNATKGEMDYEDSLVATMADLQVDQEKDSEGITTKLQERVSEAKASKIEKTQTDQKLEEVATILKLGERQKALVEQKNEEERERQCAMVRERIARIRYERTITMSEPKDDKGQAFESLLTEEEKAGLSEEEKMKRMTAKMENFKDEERNVSTVAVRTVKDVEVSKEKQQEILSSLLTGQAKVEMRHEQERKRQEEMVKARKESKKTQTKQKHNKVAADLTVGERQKTFEEQQKKEERQRQITMEMRDPREDKGRGFESLLTEEEKAGLSEEEKMTRIAAKMEEKFKKASTVAALVPRRHTWSDSTAKASEEMGPQVERSFRLLDEKSRERKLKERMASRKRMRGRSQAPPSSEDAGTSGGADE